MARDFFVGKGLLASPNQASNLFDPGGPHPIRQKHLFAVRFMRADAADASLTTSMTFLVKQIDRPTVTPVTEEINQYNKKRLIHTGVKYTPINCTLYDTADGAAMKMWLQYAAYYFGDYSQPTADAQSPTAGGMSDDILNAQMEDPSVSKEGWGYHIRKTTGTDVSGAASQYFFDRIRVYQLWGNEYTAYDLLNPRINTFTPDDLDYSNSEANTIQMSISFEAIGHMHNGLPQEVFTEASLQAMFTNGPFNGQTLEVTGHSKTVSFAGAEPPSLPGSTGVGTGLRGGRDAQLSDIFGDAVSGGIGQLGLSRDFTNSVGGVLNRFGVFDFGTVDPTRSRNIVTDVKQAVGGSSSLSNLLSGSFSGGVSTPTQSLGGVTDQTFSAVGKQALALDGMARSLNVAAKRTGTSPIEQGEREGGLSLTDDAVQAFNETKDGTFFVGFRKDGD